jgi:uncharacterized protein (DUF488 family)
LNGVVECRAVAVGRDSAPDADSHVQADRPAPLVCTVGHGARPIEAFLAVLQQASITVLIDIRRFPGSRRHPQFGRDALAAALTGAGIGYEWQGDALGGRRSRAPQSRHTALREAAFGGYADHMDGETFRTAVDALIARARLQRPTVMCAESVWWRCHRMLVADALLLRGASVLHLLDVGRRQPHRPHPTLRRGEDGWPVYDVADTLPGLDRS